jgi:CheY-like chemotaxis protein
MARILVVDDQRFCRELLQEALSDASFGGHDVTTAEDGASALALLRANEIDLLLTNIYMPWLMGDELARLAREQNPRLKVLFVSGSTGDRLEPADRPRLIQKPYHLRHLAQAVADALANHIDPCNDKHVPQKPTDLSGRDN